MKRISVFLGYSLLLHFVMTVVLLWQNPFEKSSANQSYISYEGSGSSRVAQFLGRIAAEKQARVLRQRMRAQKKLDLQIQKALRTDFSELAPRVGKAFGKRGDGPNGSQSAGDRLGESVKKINSLGLIWQRIRAKTSYRSEHILSRVAGDVKIAIRVSQKGELIRVMESDAEGDRRLLGWVVLCLIEAFREPFERFDLEGDVSLVLHFHFSLGGAVPGAGAGSTMFFPIIGDSTGGVLSRLATGDLEGLSKDISNNEVVLLRISTDRIVNLFKDKKLRHHQDWDFYTRAENYRHHCENAKNPQGCLLLANLYKSIGNHHDANRYTQLARDHEKRQRSE